MMITIEQPPAYLLVQLEALDPLASKWVAEIASKGRSRGPDISRSRWQRRPRVRRQWWGGSASPWWQTLSSSSWRHRYPRSCEVSPSSKSLACSEWCGSRLPKTSRQATKAALTQQPDSKRVNSETLNQWHGISLNTTLVKCAMSDLLKATFIWNI